MIPHNRIILIVAILIFTYIFIPYILINLNYDLWGSFSIEPIVYNKDLFSLQDLISSFLLLYIFLQYSNTNFNKNQYIDNKIIFTTIILLIFLYYNFIINVFHVYISEDVFDRSIGVKLWLHYLNNGFNSYAMTLAIILIISAHYRKNYSLYFILFFIILAQLLSGMRSEFTRILIILIAFTSKKNLIFILIGSIILIFNRQFLFGYEYDIRSFFGDAINVAYGYHLVSNVELLNCDAFNSIIRIFIPPPLRSDFMLNSGDLVLCLNTHYFSTIGIGNSILTDINKFPLETLLILFIYIFILSIFPKKYKYLITVLALSMSPHIMRLGIITGLSYTISFIIWILIPIILINERINVTKK